MGPKKIPKRSENIKWRQVLFAGIQKDSKRCAESHWGPTNSCRDPLRSQWDSVISEEMSWGRMASAEIQWAGSPNFYGMLMLMFNSWYWVWLSQTEIVKPDRPAKCSAREDVCSSRCVKQTRRCGDRCPLALVRTCVQNIVCHVMWFSSSTPGLVLNCFAKLKKSMEFHCIEMFLNNFMCTKNVCYLPSIS